MIINSPLSNHREVLPLIKAGAGAFYCGIISKPHKETTADFELINRRPDYGANFTNIQELYKAKQIADQHNISIAVTFNEFYPQSQLCEVKRLLDDILSIGIHKVIVADIGLLKYISDMHKDIDITVSIMSGIFNHQAITLLKTINPRIRKVVLPYHLTPEDFKNIVSNLSDIECESFIFNELCHYEVGLCNLTHSPYRKKYLVSRIKKSFSLDSACQKIFQDLLPYTLQNALFKTMHTYPCYVGKNDINIVTSDTTILKKAGLIQENIIKSLDPATMIFGCMACLIPELYRAGIKSVKIGGRNNSLNKKLKNVKFVNTCIKLARTSGQKYFSAFRTQCQEEFARTFFDTPRTAISCKNRYCCITIRDIKDEKS